MKESTKYYKKQLDDKNIKKEKRINKIIEILKEMLKLYLIFLLVYYIQSILTESSTMILIKNADNIIKLHGIKNLIIALIKLNITNSKYYISIILLFAITLIIYAITNRKKLSIIFTISFFYIYSMINYIITQLRGSSITLYDILSIETALNVANNTRIDIDSKMIIATYIFLITILIAIYLYQNCGKIKKKIRIVLLVSSLMAIILIINLPPIKKIRVWDTQKSYNENGVVITLLKMATNIKYKEPDDYDKEEVKAILENYNLEDGNYYADTNILVVMNESFTDFTNNKNLEISEDNIPFFHALQKEDNTISGVMYSEGYGAETANVEYEFLTQNTVAFMPKGAIPYQQYIRKKTSSIVTRLKELNYTTYGMHLWKKGGYNRETIYRLLDFDYSKFKEDYNDLNYTVNDYTTDESSYSKVKEIFQNKTKDEKIFLFNLTMQNHSPYTEIDINQPNYATEEKLNVYLQMQNYSDRALEDLIKYLKKYDEKVILLFFGDHQPSVGIDILKNDEANKWKVPYLIWANYDIEEKDYGEISTNYLQSILLEVANLPKDAYTNYMTELRKEIPVITSHYYIDSNGKKYQLDDENSPYYLKLKEYEKISYYRLKDY